MQDTDREYYEAAIHKMWSLLNTSQRGEFRAWELRWKSPELSDGEIRQRAWNFMKKQRLLGRLASGKELTDSEKDSLRALIHVHNI